MDQEGLQEQGSQTLSPNLVIQESGNKESLPWNQFHMVCGFTDFPNLGAPVNQTDRVTTGTYWPC